MFGGFAGLFIFVDSWNQSFRYRRLWNLQLLDGKFECLNVLGLVGCVFSGRRFLVLRLIQVLRQTFIVDISIYYHRQIHPFNGGAIDLFGGFELRHCFFWLHWIMSHFYAVLKWHPADFKVVGYQFTFKLFLFWRELVNQIRFYIAFVPPGFGLETSLSECRLRREKCLVINLKGAWLCFISSDLNRPILFKNYSLWSH